MMEMFWQRYKALVGVVALAFLIFGGILLYTQTVIPGERQLLQRLELEESVHGGDSPQLVETLSLLGMIYQISSRYGKAEAIYRRMLALDREHFGAEALMTRNSLLLVANMVDLQKDFARADPLFDEIARLDKKLTRAAEIELARLKVLPRHKLSPEERELVKLGKPYESNLAQTLEDRIAQFAAEGEQDGVEYLRVRAQRLGLALRTQSTKLAQPAAAK